MMSPVSNAPLLAPPRDAAGQCSTVPPSKCPLPDGELRLGPAAKKLRRFVFETVLMIDRQALQRCPLLAAVMNKLPLVFANCATRGRFDSRAKLRSALHTDEVLHWERVMGQDGACPSNFWLEGRPLCRPTIV